MYCPFLSVHANLTVPKIVARDNHISESTTTKREDHIKTHFISTPPPLFPKAPVEETLVFKGAFMVLMTNEQGYYIIDRRNTLRNPPCSLWGL